MRDVVVLLSGGLGFMGCGTCNACRLRAAALEAVEAEGL